MMLKIDHDEEEDSDYENQDSRRSNHLDTRHSSRAARNQQVIFIQILKLLILITFKKSQNYFGDC